MSFVLGIYKSGLLSIYLREYLRIPPIIEQSKIVEKMKITFLSSAFPYRGGIAVFNERLARQFKKNGDEVNIVTFNLQYPNFLSLGHFC